MKNKLCQSFLLAGIVIGTLIATVFAQSNTKFTVSDTWAHLPPNTEWGAISAVTSDGKGLILVLRRAVPSFFVLNTDGKFVKSWAEGVFNGSGPHGLRVDRDGFIWTTDREDNLIYKFTMDGKIVLQLGRKGVVGDNASHDAFNRPTDVAVAPNGDFFVSDGYGNSRVVKFSKDGKFIKIIGGTKGMEPGQFNLPHSVVFDSKGRLIVADRENARVQVFDQDGKFIELWTGLGKPYGIFMTKDDVLYVGDADGGTITIAKNGKPVEVIRDLGRPHSVSMDPSGAIYMADVRGFVKKIVPAKGSN